MTGITGRYARYATSAIMAIGSLKNTMEKITINGALKRDRDVDMLKTINQRRVYEMGANYTSYQ